MQVRTTRATLASIVEDDAAIPALEQNVLTTDGFAVLTARNGEEVRRAFESVSQQPALATG